MGYHILVVDDDQIVLESLGAVLKHGKYHVSLAHSGRQCIDSVIARRPDLIMLDMVMPGMDGTQVIAQLREKNAGDIPVILITAEGEAEQLAKKLGLAAGLNKPCTVPLILQTVARVLNQQPSLPVG